MHTPLADDAGEAADGVMFSVLVVPSLVAGAARLSLLSMGSAAFWSVICVEIPITFAWIDFSMYHCIGMEMMGALARMSNDNVYDVKDENEHLSDLLPQVLNESCPWLCPSLDCDYLVAAGREAFERSSISTTTT
jgi:hypothetical protein